MARYGLLLKYPEEPRHLPATLVPFGHGWFLNRQPGWTYGYEKDPREFIENLLRLYPYMKYDLLRLD